MPSRGLLKYIETRLQTIFFYLKCVFFLKQSPCLIYYMIFEEKHLSCYIWIVAGKGTNRDKTPFQNAVKCIFYLNGIIVIRTDSL